MAAFLYRVGRFAFRHRWYVAFVWVAVLHRAADSAAGSITLAFAGDVN